MYIYEYMEKAKMQRKKPQNTIFHFMKVFTVYYKHIFLYLVKMGKGHL